MTEPMHKRMRTFHMERFENGPVSWAWVTVLVAMLLIAWGLGIL